ncbi:hypothetical protein M3Y96_01224900 [Aphelenchoides besseyi]|nr:hypothetical protein M3Y96_01224900 [Aphelenchoides besseyi]
MASISLAETNRLSKRMKRSGLKRSIFEDSDEESAGHDLSSTNEVPLKRPHLVDLIPTLEEASIEYVTSVSKNDVSGNQTANKFRSCSSLNCDLIATFVSYYLHNRGRQISRSYLDHRNNNVYLIGLTPTEKFYRSYFLNIKWRNATHYGGRRLQEDHSGRFFTDRNCTKNSMNSQQFLLLSKSPMMHVLDFNALVSINLLKILHSRPRALHLGKGTLNCLKRSKIPLNEWLSQLEEFDYFPTFPKTSTVKEVLGICARSLKYLHLPNFIDFNALFPPMSTAFDVCVLNLKKFSVSYEKLHEIGVDLPGIRSVMHCVPSKSTEISLNSLNANPCGFVFPFGFKLNEKVEELVLSFENEKICQSIVCEFWSWIKGLRSAQTANFRKLVFSNSTLIVPANPNLPFERSCLIKHFRLIHALLTAPTSLSRWPPATFVVCGEIEIRRHFETIRPEIRVGGDIVSIVLIAQPSMVSLQFRFGQHDLLPNPLPLYYPTDSEEDVTPELIEKVMDEILTHLNALDPVAT